MRQATGGRQTTGGSQTAGGRQTAGGQRAGTRLLPTAVVLLALMALWGCEAPPLVPVALPPVPAPVVPETAESAALRAHYEKLLAGMLTTGLWRTDTAPADAPFTDRNLADNFLKIALYDEYSGGKVTQLSNEAPIALRRWAEPVRVALIFGPAVPPEQVATDTARIASYLARLAQVTGHPIALTKSAPNFWVHIATIEERRAMGPTLQAELMEITPNQLDSITNMQPDTYCQVVTQFDGGTFTYAAAVTVIPSELPTLIRLACIDEELAQSLGLPNDSNAARPSIFNDDEEFALLTRQDELMLRMLYDPSLRPGMTEREARPIVQTLATRLMGDNS